MRPNTTTSLVLLACGALTTSAFANITDFESGLEGWDISGRSNISATGGNPGANLDNELFDVFGIDIRNNTNGAYLGDLSRYGQFELTVDVKVNSLDFFGTQVPRELVVEIRDTENNHGLPYTSVYFNMGLISQAISAADEDGWLTYSVIIDDPTALGLPAGWGGYGDEDPNTFEPILPADRTFASVLASVDEITFTSFVPGFFYGFTNFDIQVDNVGLRSVPAPGSIALLGTGAIFAGRRRR